MNRLPVIETERLRLRPLQMEDSPHVFAIFSNERVLQHYGMEPHQTLEETNQMLTHMLAQIETGAIIRFAIEHLESKTLIGTIGFHNRAPSHRRAEIGYELRPEYWRSGYATEALHAALQYAETCEMERVGPLSMSTISRRNACLRRMGSFKKVDYIITCVSGDKPMTSMSIAI